MGFMDDMKAKLSGLTDKLDIDDDGKVNFEDLKAAAQEHGMGDKLEKMRDHLTDENGKVDPEEAKKALEDDAAQGRKNMDDMTNKMNPSM